MRPLVILATVSAALMAQPASANVLRYFCNGFGMILNGDRVAVTRSFSGDGKQVDAFAIWMPRVETVSRPLPGLDINLELQIQYSGPTDASIGVVDSAFLTLQAVAAPGNKQSSQSLQGELTKLKVEASVDAKPPVELAWDKSEAFFEWPTTAHSRIQIKFPDTARSVTFTVCDAKGRAINTSSFDLEHKASRDEQFRIARERADREALDYKRCSKMG